jgi:hypothetical protein
MVYMGFPEGGVWRGRRRVSTQRCVYVVCRTVTVMCLLRNFRGCVVGSGTGSRSRHMHAE